MLTIVYKGLYIIGWVISYYSCCKYFAGSYKWNIKGGSDKSNQTNKQAFTAAPITQCIDEQIYLLILIYYFSLALLTLNFILVRIKDRAITIDIPFILRLS